MHSSVLQKVLEVDTREAQRLGLLRPLVRREIEKHFADFGFEPEFVSHNTMHGLSGCHKVKVVLGVATWRRPHAIICLDEPALIKALKEFEGSVLVITHDTTATPLSHCVPRMRREPWCVRCVILSSLTD